MHAAKGLEFDSDFLPDRKKVYFLIKNPQENGDFALEEERRLAYVGITRAKRSIYIFCYEKSISWRWMDALPLN